MSESTQMSDAVQNWLADHPEFLGYMFALMMFSQTAMSVAAKSGSAGP